MRCRELVARVCTMYCNMLVSPEAGDTNYEIGLRRRVVLLGVHVVVAARNCPKGLPLLRRIELAIGIL